MQRENLPHLHDNSIGTPDTPRTSSESTYFSLKSSDEPFQLDADSLRASIRAINSTSEAEHPNAGSKLGTSPKCSSFTVEVTSGATVSEELTQSANPQHLNFPASSMDPDLSVESSFSTSFTSTVKLINPPSYIASGNTSTISPMEYSNPSRRQARIRKVCKVQPLVYSAICSLENVNQNSLGSFNHRLHMATTAKKTKNEKVDVNATTSHINQRIIQKPKSPTIVNGKKGGILSITEHCSNTTNRISALSTTLESNASNKKLSSGDNAKVSIEGGLAGATEAGNKDAYSKKSELEPIIKPKQTRDAANASKSRKKSSGKKKKVTIESKPKEIRHVELFRPSCDAYTPRMGKKIIKFKPAEQRMNMKESVGNALGTIQKPNFKDALRRVAMIIQQHVVKIERRFEASGANFDLFDPAMRDAFAEDNFVTPRYKCTMVKLPMARAGVVYGMRKIRVAHCIPTADDIYEFGHRLFNQVQLSSECSIICLIYVERIMEIAKVPLMATTWKPIFMCGLLLASKVWQDWSSWNIEFANVYPQFSLESINKLEIQFLKMVKWDLYISSSLYAKYYFALRSLLEKQNFRRRYVRMVGGVDHVAASQAVKISKRSELLKEKSLAFLSSSV